jgi:hypothetical protein
MYAGPEFSNDPKDVTLRPAFNLLGGVPEATSSAAFLI